LKKRFSSETQLTILSLFVLFSLMLVTTPATANEPMNIPESLLSGFFSQNTGSCVDVRLDAGATITPDSLNNLQKAVAVTLHSFTCDENTGVWSGYNHAQRTGLTITDSGVLISAPGGDIEYTLAMIGHEDQLRQVENGVISVDRRMMMISRPGYTEWYRNGDNSIMQGVDIMKRPGGDGNLILLFDLSGSLTPSLDNQILTFSSENGPVLKYSNLNAWDSTGRKLHLVMNLSDNCLAWEVDDRYAVYPVTIDPEFTLLQSGRGSISDGNYGYSVSVSGDYAIVGETGNDTIRSGVLDGAGAAYFYKTTDNGETWVLKQSEYGSVADGRFGHSVSISGDYAIIGEFQNATIRSVAVTKAGAVYFYRTTDKGETWVLKQSEYGSVAFGGLGYSVSVSGDYAVVGEYYNDTIRSGVVNGAGAAYFYRTIDNGETWFLKQSEYGTVPFGRFGSSVSVSGDYAAIGERYNDTIRSGVVNGAGAVYFYRTIDNGETWIMKQSEYGSVSDGCLGNSVSVSGDYAVVGEYGNDTVRSGVVNEAGAAYFYRTVDNGETWSLKQSEYGDIPDGSFGYSVSVSGDYAVVGEYGNDTVRSGAVDGAGAAYFYRTVDNGETWSMKQSEYGDIPDGNFGYSVSVYGDYAIVGETGNDTVRSGAVDGAGAAYFFLLRPEIDTYTPANGSVNVPVNSNLVAEFDKNIAAVTARNIRIYKSDDTLLQTVAADGASVTITGNTVTVNPTNFAYSTGYYVLIDAGAFKSSATGVPFTGIVDKDTWTFTTTAQPPPDTGEGDSGDNGPTKSTNIGVSSAINAGDTAKIPIKGDETAVREVDVTVNKEEASAMAIVKKLNYLPSNIIQPHSLHYQYLDIKLLKIDPRHIDSATIHFYVLRSWLEENEIKPGGLVLKHYNEKAKEWIDLPTEVEVISGGYVYYKATTPGFSYFVISTRDTEGEDNAPADEPDSVQTRVAIIPETIPQPAYEDSQTGEETINGASNLLAGPWVIICATVSVVLIGSVLIVRRKRREKFPDWWWDEE